MDQDTLTRRVREVDPQAYRTKKKPLKFQNEYYASPVVPEDQPKDNPDETFLLKEETVEPEKYEE